MDRTSADGYGAIRLTGNETKKPDLPLLYRPPEAHQPFAGRLLHSLFGVDIGHGILGFAAALPSLSYTTAGSSSRMVPASASISAIPPTGKVNWSAMWPNQAP